MTFSIGLLKTSAFNTNQILGAAKKVIKNPLVRGGAIAGAVAGGATGAMGRDEQGNRGGLGGALKGAVGGGLLGGGTALATQKIKAYQKTKQTNKAPLTPAKGSAPTPVGPDTMTRSTGPDISGNSIAR